MDCVAVGDSIAVGVGQSARCSINAKVGASSSYISDHVISKSARVAVISAGSNDPRNPRLNKNLLEIRSKIKSERVVWILPYDRTAARVVKSVAASHGDAYIDLAAYQTRDGVHPKSYSRVARDIGVSR